MNDRELMITRADTLYVHDARGRMLHSNEPDGRPAPRLFLGRTTAGDVLRFGETVPVEVADRLTAIVERLPPAADLRLPPDAVSAVRAELERHAPIASESAGPAYRFPASITMPDEVVQVTEANIEVVRATFRWLYNELADWQPCFAVVRGGAAVSVCFSSRVGDSACEAGVDTLPAFRRRGYAAAVTAAWGAAIRASGRHPLYSTSWDNIASQNVARHVGLTFFGADMTLE